MIDFLLILLVIRCVYIGIRQGLFAEMFKFLGAFAATVITLHYYTTLAQPIAQRFNISLTKTEVVTFVVLWTGVLVFFWILKETCLFLYKKDDQIKFEVSLAAILAVWRAYLLGGMFILLLFISESPSLIQQARSANLYPYFQQNSSRIYEGVYDGLIGKIFPDSRKNIKVLSLRYKQPE